MSTTLELEKLTPLAINELILHFLERVNNTKYSHHLMNKYLIEKYERI